MIVVTIKSVKIDSRKTWRQMNKPGGTGGGAAFRDAFCNRVREKAVELSPINDPDNARHRKSVVGTYRRSWRTLKAGSPAWMSAGIVVNRAKHASVVEFGRSASFKKQRFSWTRWDGDIRVVKRTSGRFGSGVLERAVRIAISEKAAICAVARANSPYTP